MKVLLNSPKSSFISLDTDSLNSNNTNADWFNAERTRSIIFLPSQCPHPVAVFPLNVKFTM